jgi:hypothetical protein
MKKIINCSFLTAILAIIYFTNVSYSNGGFSNLVVTGGCSCHSSVSNTNTNVVIDFNSGNLYYNNGQTYSLTVTVNSSSNMPSAGFALSTNLGTFGTAPAGTQLSGNVWKHSSPQATSGSSPSTTSWTINWTAPATGALPLQIFAVGNAVNGGGSGGDEWAFAPSLNVVLPVIFTHFTASSFEKNIVLNWSIADEKNVKEYQIEQSENGIDFSTIGKIEANLLASYQFIDDSKSNTALAYYRIKAIDMDGKFISSKIIKVEKESKPSSVKIYPTIVTGNTPIHIQHNESQAELMIYNMNGQLVKTQQVTSSTSNFALNEISKGIYFVFIKTNNNNISFVDKITLN